MSTNRPFCPRYGHGDVRMAYADGKQHYHDKRHPHWRCELWIGSGVCGATRELSIEFPAPSDDSTAPTVSAEAAAPAAGEGTKMPEGEWYDRTWSSDGGMFHVSPKGVVRILWDYGWVPNRAWSLDEIRDPSVFRRLSDDEAHARWSKLTEPR